MSVKIRRQNADESELTKDGRTRFTVEVPGSVGFTDLTKSRVVFDMHVDVKNAAGTIIPYPATFGQRGQMVQGPQALIKNSKVKSRFHGVLNERQHQNVIRANQDWYLSSRQLEDDRATFGNSVNQNFGHGPVSRLPDNPWLAYARPTPSNTTVTEGEAGEDTTRRRAEIPVPLRHIDQYANISQFPNVAIGDLLYEVELEDVIDVMGPAHLSQQAYRCNDVTSAANKMADDPARALVLQCTTANTNVIPKVGQAIAVWYATPTDVQYHGATIDSVSEIGGNYNLTVAGGLPTTGASEVCSDVVVFFNPNNAWPIEDITSTATQVVGSTANPFVIKGVYGTGSGDDYDWHRCPLYVGAPIYVTCNRANTTYVTYTTVNSLVAVGDDLQVVINGGAGLDVGAATAAVDAVTWGFVDHDSNNIAYTVTWTIDEAYVELMALQLTPQQQEAARKSMASGIEIPWIEERLLQKNMPSTTVHTEIWQILPNCLSTTVLTPQNLELLSGFDNCTTYRYYIDNKQVTNRDIIVGNPASAGRQIHNNNLKMYFANLGKTLKKYDSTVAYLTAYDTRRSCAMYPLNTPLVPYEQTVRLELRSSEAMSSKNLYLVSNHQRVLKISNGRVSNA